MNESNPSSEFSHLSEEERLKLLLDQQQKITGLKKALQESEDGLVALQEQLFEKKAVMDENEKFYQMAINLKQKNKELKEEIELIEKASVEEKQSLKETVTNLQRALEASQEENAKKEVVQERVGELEEEVLSLKELNESHLKELDESKEHAGQVERGIEYLRDKLEDGKLERQDLKEQLEKCQSNHHGLNLELQEMQKKLCSQQEKIEANSHQEARADEMAAKNERLRGEIDEIKQVIIAGMKETKEIKNKAIKLADEKEKWIQMERNNHATLRKLKHDLELLTAKKSQQQVLQNQERLDFKKIVEKQNLELKEKVSACLLLKEDQEKLMEQLTSLKGELEIAKKEQTSQEKGFKQTYASLESRYRALQNELKSTKGKALQLEEVEQVNEKMETLMDSLHSILRETKSNERTE